MYCETQTVKVNLKEHSYDIQIGRGILQTLDLSEFSYSKYVIITDSTVKELYGDQLFALLTKQGLAVELLSFPAGEQSKTFEVAASLVSQLAQKGVDRHAVILALGGGVTGDLAGFVASVYLRSIAYIQIPTTLLAQVDSSVGGKTAVDIPEGKNLMGTFYQPKKVFIDVDVLKTLKPRDVRNGFAEIIKYGMILDQGLFEALEYDGFNNIDDEILIAWISDACRLKAEIVRRDEKESELRKILNYGHTIGHAIEVASGYTLSHGESIAIGMVCEGKIAFKLGILSRDSWHRQNRLIAEFGLPVATECNPDIPKLIEIMKKDKKNRNGKIYFVLPTDIGQVQRIDGKVAFPVDESVVIDCLNDRK